MGGPQANHPPQGQVAGQGQVHDRLHSRRKRSAPLIIYADTSALAKLYLEEADSAVMDAAVETAESIATSLLTVIELRGALARARRDGRLSKAAHARASEALSSRWAEYHVVAVEAALVERGAGLAEAYELAAMDALQLASALEVAEQQEVPLRVATWDRRLWKAARAEGLDMLPGSAP